MSPLTSPPARPILKWIVPGSVALALVGSVELALVSVRPVAAADMPSAWLLAQAEVSHDTEVHAASDAHHAEATEHAAAEHGGGHADHTDPFDLTHANASPDLADPAALPKKDLALWSFVVFALLLAVLGKFAWGPILAALHQREEYVENQLSEARRNNEQAQKLLSDHEQKLAAAHEEIRQLMDQARKDADTHKQQVIAEAEAAAHSQKQRAVQAIEAAKNVALTELAERSVDTAVGLAGQIVRRQLNRNDHADLVRDALENFPARN